MHDITSLSRNCQVVEFNDSHIGMFSRRGPLLSALILIGLLWFPIFLVASCRAEEDTVMVFAASSLVDVLVPIGETFTSEQGIAIAFNFGGSDSLAQQIKRGAKADVFLSAGNRPMDTLEKEGFLSIETRRNILTNQLVVVSRGDRDIAFIRGANVFSSPQISRIAVTDPNLAPAGRYSIRALKNIGVWGNISGKVVFAPNVRATLAYVESGNADIGIVYRTDLNNSEKSRVIFELPEDRYEPVIYPASVLKDSSHKAAALRFVGFLADKEAKKEFRKYGFEPIDY